jgi:antitoxin component YwqK of YwqJK toxin-antitoxin module
MSVTFLSRCSGIGLVMAAIAHLSIVGALSAQEQSKESVKIKPYTGPPIFLDEKEQVVEPQLVSTKVETETFKDGKPRIEREISLFSDNHYEANGKYREFYPNGQVFVEGQYNRGRQDGEWTYYYDNGKLNRKAKYNNGKPDGLREIFRADGTLMAKRSFANGQREGEWVTYDATGKNPIAEEHYKSGKEDGIWKFWYPNGKQRQQISFKEGLRHGATIDWDDKGQKRFEANFVDGKAHGTATRWLPDGRKIVQEFDQGKLVSQSS